MPSLLTVAVTERDHIRGPETAPVTLVEYGDFECPQCAAAYPIVARVTDTFGDRVRFVFRHFPLTSSHPNAQHAAEQAEWAATQGAFWPMYDALYGAATKLSDKRMLEIAAGLGLAGRELAGRLGGAHVHRAREGGLCQRPQERRDGDAGVLHQWRATRGGVGRGGAVARDRGGAALTVLC